MGFCELARMHATRMCVCARVGGSVGRHLDGGTHSLGLYLVGETYVGRVRTVGTWSADRQTRGGRRLTAGSLFALVTVSLTRVIVCVCLVSGGRSSAFRAAAVGRLGWSCAFVVIDRAQRRSASRPRAVAKPSFSRRVARSCCVCWNCQSSTRRTQCS